MVFDEDGLKEHSRSTENSETLYLMINEVSGIFKMAAQLKRLY